MGTGRIVLVVKAIRSLPGDVLAASTRGRSKGGGESKSPFAGPLTASRYSAVSITVLLLQPETESPCQCSRSGESDTRLR